MPEQPGIQPQAAARNKCIRIGLAGPVGQVWQVWSDLLFPGALAVIAIFPIAIGYRPWDCAM